MTLAILISAPRPNDKNLEKLCSNNSCFSLANYDCFAIRCKMASDCPIA